MLNTSLLITIAAIAVGLWFVFLAVRQSRMAKEAQETWVKTSGVVLDSGLTRQHSQSSKGSSSTKYTAAPQLPVLGGRVKLHRRAARLRLGELQPQQGGKDHRRIPEGRAGDRLLRPRRSVQGGAGDESVWSGTPNLTLGIIFLVLGVLAYWILPH